MTDDRQDDETPAVEGEWRGFDAPEGIDPHFAAPDRLPSEIAREAAGEIQPVIESLASKECPYIVKAFDTPGGADYNSDYSWHALDKEKRWELPGSGMLGGSARAYGAKAIEATAPRPPISATYRDSSDIAFLPQLLAPLAAVQG